MSLEAPHAFADAHPIDGIVPDEPDNGLAAFAVLLAMHRVAVSPPQLRHHLGHQERVSGRDLLRLSRTLDGVKARLVEGQNGRLTRAPLPALAHGAGGWFVIGRVLPDGVLVQRVGEPVTKVDRAQLDAMWDGRLLLLTTRESAAGGAGRFDMRWFVPQVVRYRKLIGEVLVITLAVNLLGLASPLLFQNVIDKVLVHDAMATLTVLTVALVAAALWETALGWMRTRLYSETSQKIDVELGARLFRHLLALPLGYFEARRVGDTVTRVRQLETIREFLTNASLSVFVDPLFAVVFLVAMALYSLPLLGVVCLSLVAYVLVSQTVTGALRRRLADKFERGSASQALLVESVTGIHTVKASAVEPQWQERWERQLAGYSAAAQRVTNLNNSGGQAIQLISKLTLAAILFFGAREVIAGTLTVGGLVAFNMFAQRVSGPVVRLAQLWQDFQQVRISIERLGDVLNAAPEPQGPSGASLPAIRGRVRFDDVRFRYAEEGPWTLDGVSLEVPAGGSVGIVGSSGSGKSTLTKLLQRLYIPASGRVLVDDIDVAQADPAWLRRQIGVVLQENLLFNRSVRENIALANPAMPLDRVIAAARLAGAHDFILKMPQGYDTAIVERGANLSGGQRQRIAIARALVTSPRILIFDEATSALDAESEAIIQDNLKAMSRDRTVLIIAHRLSAIRQCDTIVALENGRIVERGSHDELLALGGRYAALHAQQNRGSDAGSNKDMAA